MNRRECPGWTADWLTGWLAAVGTTVMVPGMKLSWKGAGNATRAVLHHPDSDPLEALAQHWPDGNQFDALPWPRSGKTEQGVEYGFGKLSPNDFARYAQKALTHCPDVQWASAALYTDTKLDRDGMCLPSQWGFVARGRDPHESVRCCLAAVTENKQRIALSAEGTPDRPVKKRPDWGRKPALFVFGLQNDYRRLIYGRAELGQGGVDFAAEALSFYGFGVLGPVTIHNKVAKVTGEHRHDGESRLYIPAWSEPLDRYAVAALMGYWHDLSEKYGNDQRLTDSNARRVNDLGIYSAWRTVSIATGRGRYKDVGYKTELVFSNT